MVAAQASSTRRWPILGFGRQQLAAALAGKFKPGLRTGKRQYSLVDQRVVHDDIGLGEARERIEREQAGSPSRRRRARHGPAQRLAHRLAWPPSRPMPSWRISPVMTPAMHGAKGRSKGLDGEAGNAVASRIETTGACAAAAPGLNTALIAGKFPDLRSRSLCPARAATDLPARLLTQQEAAPRPPSSSRMPVGIPTSNSSTARSFTRAFSEGRRGAA